MATKTFMIIAGETSGDTLGAELVQALKTSDEVKQNGWQLSFFGAGGPKLADAGVELEFDLTAHAVFGITDVLINYRKFRRLFNELVAVATERKPDVIVLIDYAGFNRRFAKAIREATSTSFDEWHPRIVYYVSPQVWASRESRAFQLARDIDLLLSIFPFEKAWYAKRVPNFRVEYVGHPIIDRYSKVPRISSAIASPKIGKPLLLLLPGSRKRELQAHLPIMVDVIQKLRSEFDLHIRIVLPNERLSQLASEWTGRMEEATVQIGGLADSLAQAEFAIASSGTVTVECAYFRVPTVVMYKTSWLTYEIGKRIIKVPYIAMPNLLANEVVYPEFIQNEATSENVAKAVASILRDPSRRQQIQQKLSEIVSALGAAGANQRAAHAVFQLLQDN